MSDVQNQAGQVFTVHSSLEKALLDLYAACDVQGLEVEVTIKRKSVFPFTINSPGWTTAPPFLNPVYPTPPLYGGYPTHEQLLGSTAKDAICQNSESTQLERFGVK